MYTNIGYSSFYAERHWKKYFSTSDELCANLIRDARLYPELDREIYDEITVESRDYAP